VTYASDLYTSISLTLDDDFYLKPKHVVYIFNHCKILLWLNVPIT